MRFSPGRALCALMLVGVLSGCGEEEPEAPEPVVCLTTVRASPQAIEMIVGNSVTVFANQPCSPVNPLPLRWELGDSAVATVTVTSDSTALVGGKKAGATTLHIRVSTSQVGTSVPLRVNSISSQ
jgi:hypothetical protein